MSLFEQIDNSIFFYVSIFKCLILLSFSATIASISANLNSVTVLNKENFKDWKENTKIVLGCMDLDLALRKEQPAPHTKSTTYEQRKDYEKWGCSNPMCLMIIKRNIPEVFLDIISEDITNVKDFLAEIEKRFKKSDKA